MSKFPYKTTLNKTFTASMIPMTFKGRGNIISDL